MTARDHFAPEDYIEHVDYDDGCDHDCEDGCWEYGDGYCHHQHYCHCGVCGCAGYCDDYETYNLRPAETGRRIVTAYEIKLKGCDDSTVFTMELTTEEAAAVERVAARTREVSEFDCMPTMTLAAQ